MTSSVFHGPDWTKAVHHLICGPRFRFGERLSSLVPTAGVYAIWQGASLIYVGMAGRGLAEASPIAHQGTTRAKTRGLADRLTSHASGRRSGDAFCIYVCDRLVLPRLTPEQISQVAAGAVSLDEKTRAFIHEHLSYSYVVVPDGRSALALETLVKMGATDVGPPLLNPIK